MTLFFYEDDVDLGATAVRLNGVSLSSLADGTPSFGGLLIDDPSGTRVVQGWHSSHVNETACVAAPRLFTGWVADHVYRRSTESGRTEDAREIDINLIDQNEALNIRLGNLKAAKRPVETDFERIDWLLGSNDFLNGLVQDLGLVNRTYFRQCEEADYRGQKAVDVLNDCIGPDRRIFFVYWDQVAEALGLFYDFPGAVSHTSTLTISNVLSDLTLDANGNVTGTCFPPFMDAELHRDPSTVYSRIRTTGANGTWVDDNATTAATYFPSPLLTRGIQVDNSRIGKEATARFLNDAFLDKASVVADTISVTLLLPNTHVGLIDAGMRVGIRFSHLPGYESQVYSRVTLRNVEQAPGDDTQYIVKLELSTYGRTSTGGGGAAGPGDFPHPPSGPPSFEGYNDNKQGVNDGSLPSAPADGDLLVLFVASRLAVAPLGVIAGWTKVANTDSLDTVFGPNYHYAALYTREASGDSATPYTPGAGECITIANYGDATFDQVATNPEGTSTSLLTGSVTPTGPALVVGCAILASFDALTVSRTVPSGTTELSFFVNNSGNHPYVWSGYKTVATPAATSIGATVAFSDPSRVAWGGITYSVISSAEAGPPLPARQVPWEVVTMTTEGGVSHGTTHFPYAGLSLEVKVGSQIISPASITEVDPSCGDFALTWEVDPRETVFARYIGA